METSQILLIFFGGLVPMAAVAFALGRRKALLALSLSILILSIAIVV